jgi:hypothetical protein
VDEAIDQDPHLHQGASMLFYPAALPLSRQTLDYTAGIIRRHRRQIGTPRRKLKSRQQALLVLAYLRKGEATCRRCALRGNASTLSRTDRVPVSLEHKHREAMPRALPWGRRSPVGPEPDHLCATAHSAGSASSRLGLAAPANDG